jgi:hypothetical protein
MVHDSGLSVRNRACLGIQNLALTTRLQISWSMACILSTTMGYDQVGVWAISGNRSHMFGWEISSGAEDTFIAKGM